MSGRRGVFEQAAGTVEAVIRRSPEDFLVEEIPAYLPSGRGEHLFVTFTKRGMTTPDAVRALAQALGVDPRGAGFAGMKDRHAVTTQTASFPFPLARDADAAMAGLSVPNVAVVSAARHDNKLKPGHLAGNRFTIALVDVLVEEVPELVSRLSAIGRAGVPNAFGPQRFGRDGDNPVRALAWLAGKERGPRAPREQRLLFSSLQSLLFNRVLERREQAGTWAAVLPGDLAKRHDTGGLFPVPLEGPALDDARARAEAGSISATGPMFGAKMRWPEGEPAALEREILAAASPEALYGGAASGPTPRAPAEPIRWEALRHLGEGTRRPLRLFVAEMTAEAQGEARAGRAVVVARFVLPKGGYATTVLGRACRLVDGSRGAALVTERDEDLEPPEL
jgi:tRNA pseudouridine13 synthase